MAPIHEPILKCSKLQAAFRGIEDARFTERVWHFRGLPYGSIARRFESPRAVATTNSKEIVDAICFGPQCPQVPLDVGHLLRLPKHISQPKLEEDEFRCLNLNVSCPPCTAPPRELCPVFVWIHGGSQTVTFASAASPVCDPTCLVSTSIAQKKPIIIVTLNYRLNIFAFGNGKGEKNLALQDQSLALQWVRSYIRDFGGDPEDITLAGESAGAVYVHAHILSGVEVKRAILASGSLYLSPPLPEASSEPLLRRLEQSVTSIESGKSLEDASASTLIAAMSTCGVVSMWLQETPSLAKWKFKRESVEALMIGDVEFESAIWATGILELSPEFIDACFDDALGSASSETIKEAYHVIKSRPMSARLGALDFLNDSRFALPAYQISQRWRRGNQGGNPGIVFQYVLDQTNPWQASSRAHHAVDLILAFGGIDISFNTAAQKVSSILQSAWIAFANGEKPWDPQEVFAFGPCGICGPLKWDEYRCRRRADCFELLQDIQPEKVQNAVSRLGTGRLNLLN